MSTTMSEAETIMSIASVEKNRTLVPKEPFSAVEIYQEDGDRAVRNPLQ